MFHPQHTERGWEREGERERTVPNKCLPLLLLPQIPDAIERQLNCGPATQSSLLDRMGYFPHRPLHGDPAGGWSNSLNPKCRRGWGGGGAGQRGPRRHPAQSGPEAEVANWKSSE